MASRTVRNSAGKRLRRTLNATLQPETEWTESESITLDILEAAADRVAALHVLLDVEMVKEPVSTRRVTELAAEVRQHEAAIAKMVASLDPNMEQAKSQRHVAAAANARWSRR